MYGLSDADIQKALAANGTPDGTNGAGVVTTSVRTVARFFMHATRDSEASLKEGRTIYREEAFVELRPEGNRQDSSSHAVTDEDRRNFPNEWAQFQRQLTSPVHSVMSLPGFGAKEFRYCDDAQIFTIEALSESNVQPELQALKAMAIRWLMLAKPEAAVIPIKKRGRPKGSKNVKDAQAAS